MKSFRNSVARHEFWKEAPEDLLLEIFIRLPDCRSAVRCSTVCPMWRALILRNPQFIWRFKSQHHQHQDRYPPAFLYAVMFRTATTSCDPICQLYSDEWMFLHGTLQDNCLDFLPSPMVIRASCNDLLLVSPSLCQIHLDGHYICNPITKHFVRLPRIPRHDEVPSLFVAVGCALICMPRGRTSNSRFMVVEFLHPDIPFPFLQEHRFSFDVIIFCSESRMWETKTFHYPLPSDTSRFFQIPSDIVTCNGILYWLEQGQNTPSKVVYLDLMKEQCGAIGIPQSGDCFYHPHRIGTVRVSGGELELRLIQVHDDRLIVWRLNDNDDDIKWALIHNIRLGRPDNLGTEQLFTGQFVHPTNGDLVFIVWGQSVFEYNLAIATYKKIDGLLGTIYNGKQVLTFPMVHSYGASNIEF